jgi:hypothetical protein
MKVVVCGVQSVVVKGLRKTVVSVCLLSVEYDVVVVQ